MGWFSGPIRWLFGRLGTSSAPAGGLVCATPSIASRVTATASSVARVAATVTIERRVTATASIGEC